MLAGGGAGLYGHVAGYLLGRQHGEARSDVEGHLDRLVQLRILERGGPDQDRYLRGVDFDELAT